jgi:2-oxoglutarate ferredoxin oxidoreductase subunit alpha
MMEPAELPEMRPLPEKRPAWAVTGAKGRPHNVISSLYMGAEELEALNLQLQDKLRHIEQNEVRYEASHVDDAEVVIVAFGTAARVAHTSVQHLRAAGLPVGLFRPITLWPFPEKELAALARRIPSVRAFLVVEMNAGQMVHDVREAVDGHVPVKFKGRMGGIIPLPEEIEEAVCRLIPTAHSQAFRVEAKNGRVAH